MTIDSGQQKREDSSGVVDSRRPLFSPPVLHYANFVSSSVQRTSNIIKMRHKRPLELKAHPFLMYLNAMLPVKLMKPRWRRFSITLDVNTNISFMYIWMQGGSMLLFVLSHCNSQPWPFHLLHSFATTGVSLTSVAGLFFFFPVQQYPQILFFSSTSLDEPQYWQTYSISLGWFTFLSLLWLWPAGPSLNLLYT